MLTWSVSCAYIHALSRSTIHVGLRHSSCMPGFLRRMTENASLNMPSHGLFTQNKCMKTPVSVVRALNKFTMGLLMPM